jgi:hypothetical protein
MSPMNATLESRVADGVIAAYIRDIAGPPRAAARRAAVAAPAPASVPQHGHMSSSRRTSRFRGASHGRPARAAARATA